MSGAGSARAEVDAAFNEGVMEGVAGVLRVINEHGHLPGWARFYEHNLKVAYDGQVMPFRVARVLARRGRKADEQAFDLAQAKGMFDGLSSSPEDAR